ncbi:unnamed protein product, partial [marine sediment metagenome]
PSVEKDTSPLSLLSAMASGLPIVAFDIPGVHEVVNKEGILVQVADVEQFSSRLDILLSDEKRRRYLGYNARKRAVDHLSLDAHIITMQNTFKKCCSVYSSPSTIH